MKFKKMIIVLVTVSIAAMLNVCPFFLDAQGRYDLFEYQRKHRYLFDKYRYGYPIQTKFDNWHQPKWTQNNNIINQNMHMGKDLSYWMSKHLSNSSPFSNRANMTSWRFDKPELRMSEFLPHTQFEMKKLLQYSQLGRWGMHQHTQFERWESQHTHLRQYNRDLIRQYALSVRDVRDIWVEKKMESDYYRAIPITLKFGFGDSFGSFLTLLKESSPQPAPYLVKEIDDVVSIRSLLRTAFSERSITEKTFLLGINITGNYFADKGHKILNSLFQPFNHPETFHVNRNSISLYGTINTTGTITIFQKYRSPSIIPGFGPPDIFAGTRTTRFVSNLQIHETMKYIPLNTATDIFDGTRAAQIHETLTYTPSNPVNSTFTSFQTLIMPHRPQYNPIKNFFKSKLNSFNNWIRWRFHNIVQRFDTFWNRFNKCWW